MKEKQQELARGDSGDMSLLEGRGEEMLDILDVAKGEKHKVVIQIEDENNKDNHPVTEDSQSSATKNDPIKMLKNRPKRSSLKQSCLHPRKVGKSDQKPKSNLGEVSSDEELIPDFQMISNVFQNRRKSCNSWRGRQRDRVAGGSVSSESEVFEIIHMEESSEEEEQVTSLDKFITGLLISATILAVCYLFWAQNIPKLSNL